MKLVTFDEGRVGYLDGDEVVELDVPSTRAWFERGGDAAETGARLALERDQVRRREAHATGKAGQHHGGAVVLPEPRLILDCFHPV